MLASAVRTTTSNATVPVQPLFVGPPQSTFSPFEPLPAGR
jgi:hypothetical protein